MRTEWLDYWQCIQCGSCEYQLNAIKQEGEDIVQGTLQCKGCGKEYPLYHSILHTHPALSKGMQDEIMDARQKTDPEKGKVFPITQEKPMDDAWLLSLPVPHYHAGAWNPANDIVFVLDQLHIQKDTRILDLGAGVCWTSRDLASRSQHVVAVDILDDKFLGLESGNAYIQATGRFFDRINAVMELLPFRDNTFDVILTNCSAHHAEDLSRLFTEIRRVLKPGGAYVISNELTQGLLKKSELVGNDHYYTIQDYLRNLTAVGFKPQIFFPRSIHETLMNGALKRKSGKWQNVGKIASQMYRRLWLQKVIHQNTFFLSKLFGLPPIIISYPKKI